MPVQNAALKRLTDSPCKANAETCELSYEKNMINFESVPVNKTNSGIFTVCLQASKS